MHPQQVAKMQRYDHDWSTKVRTGVGGEWESKDVMREKVRMRLGLRWRVYFIYLGLQWRPRVEGKVSDSEGGGDEYCDGRWWGQITPPHVRIRPHTHWHACMDAHSLTLKLTDPLTHSHSHSLTHTHRLPPGYRDLIQFFYHNPGLIKWTGRALLLYFNAGSLDAARMFTL